MDKNIDGYASSQNRRSYFVFLVIQLLAKVLPRSFAYWLALRCAAVKAISNKEEFNAVKNNLRYIYKYKNQSITEKQLHKAAFEVYRNFGKYLVDFFFFSPMSHVHMDKYVTVEGEDYLKEAIAYGKGTVLLSAHLGNWELGAAALTLKKYPITAVVLDQKDEHTSLLLNVMRIQRGIEPVSLGSAGKIAIKTLKEQKNIALLVDRDYSNKNEKFEFMGRMAFMPSGPARLAIKTGSPLIFGCMSRQKKDRFLLEFLPAIYPENHNIDSLQKEICRVLGDFVSKYPEQWYIFYDFWNEKPVQY